MANVYLLQAEGGTERANGLCILGGLLLHLQQLGGLDNRFYGGYGSTLVQILSSQPFLQLTDVVPETKPMRLLLHSSDISEDMTRPRICLRASNVYLSCMPVLQEQTSLRSSRLLRVTALME